MRAGQIAGLLLALGFTVSGCADRTHEGGRTADAKVCSPFAALPAATTDPASVTAASGAGDAAALDDCLHRWGYRLAKSSDRADLAAQAVVAACSPVLSRWNQSSLTQPDAGPDTAVSLVTGKTQNAPAERFETSQAKALFYVVQARAGNCAAP
jgi:hypothetical protein